MKKLFSFAIFYLWLAFASAFQNVEFMQQLTATDSIQNDSIALIKLEQLIKDARPAGEELLFVNSRIAKRANVLQQFTKAIQLSTEGIELSRKLHLDSLEGLFNILTGITNYYMERREQSIPFFKEGIRIAEKNNYWSMEARALHNAAGALTDINDFKTAEEYLIKSLSIRTAHHQEHTHDYLLSMRVLATLYERTDRTDKAEEIYKKLIEEGKLYHDTSLLASNLMFYSGTLNKKGKLKEAVEMSGEALSYLRKTGDFHGIIGALLVHAKHLEDAGRYQEALTFEREALIMERKSFKADLDKQIGEIEVKYQTAEKENQIKLQTAEIETQKTRNIFLSISIFLIIITGTLLFNRYRLKAKQEAQEERIRQERLRNQSMIRSQEEERSRVSRELHDGLGQMLSAARMNLASIDNGNHSAEFKKALEMIDESCVEVRNISHDLMPSLLVKSGLIAAIEELANKMNASGKMKIFVDYDENSKRFPVDVEINFFRILQELLNNIIKHSFATEVHIQFTTGDDYLSIMMEDNGKGFDKELLFKSKGNGWNNIQSRLALINGTIEIDSQPGNGTAVYMEASLKEKLISS